MLEILVEEKVGKVRCTSASHDEKKVMPLSHAHLPLGSSINKAPIFP